MVPLLYSCIMRFVFLFHITAWSPYVLGHGGIWNYSIAGKWRPGYCCSLSRYYV